MPDKQASSLSTGSSSYLRYTTKCDDILKEKDDASDNQLGVIRLCPHQKLSYDKFRKIAKLMETKKIDEFEALVKIPEHRESAKMLMHLCSAVLKYAEEYHADDIRRCSMKHGETGVKFVTQAQVLRWAGGSPGLPVDFVLYFIREFGLPKTLLKEMEPATLTKLLKDVSLCQHMKLGDPKIAEPSWSALHPDRHAKTPRQSDGLTADCDQCRTKTKIEFDKSGETPCLTFTTRRMLEGGDWAFDPI
ncbi:hypothetical protein ACLMJK_006143 [Lecanora helva]